MNKREKKLYFLSPLFIIEYSKQEIYLKNLCNFIYVWKYFAISMLDKNYI